MANRISRAVTLPAAFLACVSLAAPASGQERLTAMILRGAATRPGSATAGPAVFLQPGLRVESPAGSWTELAFSDGTSIVLEPGADFTLQDFGRNKENGHLLVRGSAGRGRLRISTSDRVDVEIVTQGATVRVISASAIMVAGRGGSVTLVNGGRVVVARNGEEDVLRRSGFSLLFDDGFQRRSRTELAELVDPFAPVAMGGGQVGAIEVAEAPAQATSPAAARRLTRVTATEGIAYSTPSRTNSGGGGSSGGGGGSGGAAAGSTAVQRSSAALTLALGGSLGGSTIGSGFSAPGPNSGTSSLNTFQNSQLQSQQAAFNINQTTPDAVIADLGQAPGDQTNALTQFGTGRVRRFTPGASGATNPRTDTGLVTIGASTGPVSGVTLFQNVANRVLNSQGTTTFYDAVANVGVVTLVVLQPSGSDPSRSGSLLFQPGTIPRIAVSDGSTPTLTFTRSAIDPSGAGSGAISRAYNGSAILENALGPNTPSDGRVTALQGTTGLIAVKSASSLPSPNVAQTGPNTCIPVSNCRIFPDTGDSASRLATPTPGSDTSLTIGAVSGSPRTDVTAGIYIIDKITQSSEQVTTLRQIQPGERYFVIGGVPVAPTAQGLPGMAPGSTTRYAISDGLDPARAGLPRGFVAGQTIESRFVAPGNNTQPLAFNQYNAFRPEETFVPNAPRGDTHLLVTADPSARNPGDPSRNPAMRADLQITADGRSSASASVGGIVTLPAGQQGRTVSALALSGQTVGSAQLDTARTATLIQSNLGSLGTDAAGAGAHLLGESDRAPGQAGYFAVGQADTRLGAPGTNAGVQPGTLQGIGQDTSSQFAYTRLATNVGPAGQQIGAIDLQGYATGVVQSVRNGQATLYGVSTSQHGDAAISNAGAASPAEFNALFRLAPTAVGELSFDQYAAPAPGSAGGVRTVTFGGQPGDVPTTSAPSPNTFAGIGPGRAMASVDADLRAGIQGVDGNTIPHPVTGASIPADLPASSPHLTWGWFLGDVAAQANSGTDRDHVNLGFWVAGRTVTLDGLRSLTGTATYSGGLAGTAADGSSVRTVVGQFAHQWDFAQRTGRLNASFDGTSWTGVSTNMPSNAMSFTGASSAVASPGRGDLTLSVQGSFFHDPATGGPLTSANLPQAMGGLFGVRSSAGTYGANGVLVGTRR